MHNIASRSTLLEDLRHPVVDLFVLRLCNLAMMRPEEGAASISPTHLLRRQVECLADDLRGGAPYRPFRFRG